MTNGYRRYWSSFWLAMACPALLVAFVMWSHVVVVVLMLLALSFAAVICGSLPARGSDPATSSGGGSGSHLLGPALRWAVIAVALAVTAVAAPWVAVLVLAAVIGTSPWAVGRLRGRTTSEKDQLSPERIRMLLRQLDVAGLCGAWRSSHALLTQAHDVEAHSKVVMLRQEYLDEMERRDAEGFQAWLAVSRAAEDPEAYLREKPRDGGAAAA